MFSSLLTNQNEDTETDEISETSTTSTNSDVFELHQFTSGRIDVKQKLKKFLEGIDSYF